MIIKEFHTYVARLNIHIMSSNISGKHYKVFLTEKVRADLVTSTLGKLSIKRK
jgi:hypothetical protein